MCDTQHNKVQQWNIYDYTWHEHSLQGSSGCKKRCILRKMRCSYRQNAHCGQHSPGKVAGWVQGVAGQGLALQTTSPPCAKQCLKVLITFNTFLSVDIVIIKQIALSRPLHLAWLEKGWKRQRPLSLANKMFIKSLLQSSIVYFFLFDWLVNSL